SSATTTGRLSRGSATSSSASSRSVTASPARRPSVRLPNSSGAGNASDAASVSEGPGRAGPNEGKSPRTQERFHVAVSAAWWRGPGGAAKGPCSDTEHYVRAVSLLTRQSGALTDNSGFPSCRASAVVVFARTRHEPPAGAAKGNSMPTHD